METTWVIPAGELGRDIRERHNRRMPMDSKSTPKPPDSKMQNARQRQFGGDVGRNVHGACGGVHEAVVAHPVLVLHNYQRFLVQFNTKADVHIL